MKKLINTILLLVVAIVLIFPANHSQAAPVAKRRLASTYKKELTDYLINYRAPVGSGNKCPSTVNRPPDCLSLIKVDQILTQLDNDNYFDRTDPSLRREYLLATSSQSYVMRKIVMYFEDNLNHDTVIYDPTVTAEKNYGIIDDVNRYLLDPMNDLGLAVLGQPSKGDSLILALACNRNEISSGIYEYVLKTKPSIPQHDLNILYGFKPDAMGNPFDNTRLGQFSDNNSDAHPSWTLDEQDAIYIVTQNANKTINFARKHNLSPKETYVMKDAMVTAIGMMGPPSGAGGMSAARGANPNLAQQIIRVGTRSSNLDYSAVKQAFQYSTIPTAQFNKTTGVYLGGMTNAMETINRVAVGLDGLYNFNKRFIGAGEDAFLLDVALNRTNIVSGNWMGSAWISGAQASSSFPGTKPFSIFLHENYAVGDEVTRLTVHEGAHLERLTQLIKRGIPDEGGINGYHFIEEGMTTFIENETMKFMGRASSGSSSYAKLAIYIDKTARLIAKKQGISYGEAKIKLTNIYWQNSYTTLDSLIGPGYTAGLNSLGQKALEDVALVNRLARTQGSQAYRDAFSKYTADQLAIDEFISKW